MRQFRQLFLLAILALTVFACSKDDDPAPKTKADVLAAHSWRITGLTVNPPLPFENDDETTTAISDLYNQYFGACVRDDIFNFRSDGTYTVEDVGTSCNGDKIRTYGSWIMSSDETAVVLTGGGLVSYLTQDVENWNITALNDDTLTATTMIYTESTAYTVTYTFTVVK
ncbi:hypothetical protein QNI16_28195 [Cytophagaceae bacterium YF14B1]|uniref:Lipocalin-like domain-containing protein n=1 Tax=Xanthocytophaga flava TaxID=3048013 RepID=A0AAE3UA72_9BACT|nr:hypothetical protein [Xanthocytophaga flavus]MDJ1484412.1 hypothetical protein [Xanthocytophaga flavus]